MVPPNPSFINFSSDLDESQNRFLGQVGGGASPQSPRGYATVVIYLLASHIFMYMDLDPDPEIVNGRHS